MNGPHLRTRFVAAALGLALLPLLLSGGVALRVTRGAMIDSAAHVLAGAARQTAAEIDGFFLDSLDGVRTHSRLPEIVDYLASPPADRGAREGMVLFVLDALRRRDHLSITSYALFDPSGAVLIDTAGATTPDVETAALLAASSAGLPFAYTLRQGEVYDAVAFASPVRDSAGRMIGFLRVRYHFSVVQRIVYEKEGAFGPGSRAMLLDEAGARIAGSHDRTLHYTSIDAATRERLRARPTTTTQLYPETKVLAAAAPLAARPWLVVTAVPEATVLAGTIRQALYSIAILVAIGLVAFVAALLAARALTRPILEVAANAERLARGDLCERVDPSAGGEIGRLAESFNSMAEALLASREELLANARRLEGLLAAIPDAVFVHAVDGRILDVNDVACELYGLSRPEILACNVGEISGGGHTQEMAAARIAEAHAKGSADFEWQARRRDGSVFPSYVRLRRLNLGGEAHVLAVVTDMTTRKALEGQLLQAQKMEAIGTLAGGLAHDFNNLLMGVQGCVSLASLALPTSHPVQPDLQRIEELVRSGAGLTRQLLGFARGGRYEVRPLDLNQIVRRTAAMFGRTRRDVAVTLRLADDLCAVDGDEGQIEQVLLNFLVNAGQAMPDGGEVVLATESVTLAAPPRPAGLAPGRFARVVVSDTGTGMDERTLARVFEPFFSTKERGRGTGLGLASAFGIVQSHGGAIEAASVLGHGSTFTIHLPASSRAAVEAAPPVEAIPRGEGHLLLVDDEPAVLEVTAKLLSRIGYQVSTAASGAEAISWLAAHRGAVDLVILDMIMPGMSGEQAYAELRALAPDLRVVLSSGYSLDEKAQSLLDAGCRGFISKPYSLGDLARKLHLALADRRPAARPGG